jgi:hypothetical protein
MRQGYKTCNLYWKDLVHLSELPHELYAMMSHHQDHMGVYLIRTISKKIGNLYTFKEYQIDKREQGITITWK